MKKNYICLVILIFTSIDLYGSLDNKDSKQRNVRNAFPKIINNTGEPLIISEITPKKMCLCLENERRVKNYIRNPFKPDHYNPNGYAVYAVYYTRIAARNSVLRSLDIYKVNYYKNN
ncbi:hypothetical protein EKK58_06460 [Candidatus Dependentiae bacterium]|nr:MAG: hypothetical protein EKK58_06460 [Candidatus Dependentiae bacterium]